MVMREVCDAWIEYLKEKVSALSSAKVHRYAVWSENAIHDTTAGLHLAVWPEADPQVAARTDTQGGDTITTSYVIQVWQQIPSEAQRVYDDDKANAAWLDLYEEVMGHFYSRANMDIGDAGSDLQYAGGAFANDADLRVFALRFTKHRYQQALP